MNTANKKIFIFIISAFLLIFTITSLTSRSIENTPNNYVSHSFEPHIGDKIKNNNPSCKHFESTGTVTDISSLTNDMGKTVTYQVENNGSTYCKGQTLNKTMDQLAPI